MEIATTVINAAVVAAVGLIVGWLVKGMIDRLEREIAALRAEMRERFARMDDRIDRGFDSIRSEYHPGRAGGGSPARGRGGRPVGP